MIKKPWFKAKRYGWGWYPATGEGWIVTLLYVIILFHQVYAIDIISNSTSDTLISSFVPVALLTMLLLMICDATGEKPRWR